MLDFWNLRVFVLVTKYFSECLVSILLLFNVNKCFVAACFVALIAHLRVKKSLLESSPGLLNLVVVGLAYNSCSYPKLLYKLIFGTSPNLVFFLW